MSEDREFLKAILSGDVERLSATISERLEDVIREKERGSGTGHVAFKLSLGGRKSVIVWSGMAEGATGYAEDLAVSYIRAARNYRETFGECRFCGRKKRRIIGFFESEVSDDSAKVLVACAGGDVAKVKVEF